MGIHGPFAGVDRRVAWVRGVLLLAMLLGMIASPPVWFNERNYPLIPVTGWFPILAAPWDKCLFAVMLLSLVAAGWWYRPSVIAFLAAAVFAFGQDQNRGQPWFYMYCVMLFFMLFPAPVSLAACRWALTAVYFWGGVQKLNARYFQIIPEWFAEPLKNSSVPAFLGDLLRWSVSAAPFIEIAIGVALWIPKLRLAAILTATILHVTALLVLGPLGHDFNWVVWPWNLAMVTLLAALFLQRHGAGGNRAAEALDFRHAFKSVQQSRSVLVVLTLFALLPAFSFVGKWDSDFSFALYSENTAVANIFVTEAYGDRLPEHLRRYVKPFNQPYDPQHQGPFQFEYRWWCDDTLHVPPFPEPRHYRAIYQYLRIWSREPADLRMIIGTRSGLVEFHEADRVEYLQPAK